MPLPPALAARLQKRGLVTEQEQKPAAPTTAKTTADEEVEEVFAEDYDDPVKDEQGLPEPASELPPPEIYDDDHEFIREVPACPNRSNPFHECCDFCKEKWGMKMWNPEEKMIKKRQRMLNKYPLPPEWEEVADPETDRYYYWNTQTDQVAWLSPIHPQAIVTISAEKLQAVLRDTGTDRVDSDSEGSEEDMDASDSESSSSSSSEEEDYERRHDRGRPARDRGGRGGARSRGRTRDDLDPMDPASYSDIPRGGWSSGLERSGEAKTGVDTTASGPLFQQRPYPSPGAVLRANKASKS